VMGEVRDGALLDRLLRTGAFDAVLAGAAITAGPQRQREAPAEIIEVNLAAVARLAALAAKHGVRRVVALSSSAAMGELLFGERPVREEDAPRPATIYGVTKAGIEMLLAALPDLRVARVAAVFGPWERATGVRDFLSPLYQLARAAAQRRAVAPLPAGGARDWVYAPYAASALEWLLTAPRTEHRLYNLGAGCVWHPREFADALGLRLDGGEAIAFNDDVERRRTFLAMDRMAKEFAMPPAPVEAVAAYGAWVASHREWFA